MQRERPEIVPCLEGGLPCIQEKFSDIPRRPVNESPVRRKLAVSLSEGEMAVRRNVYRLLLCSRQYLVEGAQPASVASNLVERGSRASPLLLQRPMTAHPRTSPRSSGGSSSSSSVALARCTIRRTVTRQQVLHRQVPSVSPSAPARM